MSNTLRVQGYPDDDMWVSASAFAEQLQVLNLDTECAGHKFIDVKKAWRFAISKHHPDRLAVNTVVDFKEHTERCQVLNAAYVDIRMHTRLLGALSASVLNSVVPENEKEKEKDEIHGNCKAKATFNNWHGGGGGGSDTHITEIYCLAFVLLLFCGILVHKFVDLEGVLLFLSGASGFLFIILKSFKYDAGHLDFIIAVVCGLAMSGMYHYLP
ncbi:hypothetical protein HAP94_12175 [Acidithiobacillus ferrivorans]|nr:hypothetical protein [Acidithiobacillus ferrivorans]